MEATDSFSADIRAILVAGVGFLLDSYDIFSINLITTLLGMVFWSGKDVRNGFGGNNGILPDATTQALKASTSAGIVTGMILFGWLAEYVHRCQAPCFLLLADDCGPQCLGSSTHVWHRAGHHHLRHI